MNSFVSKIMIEDEFDKVIKSVKELTTIEDNDEDDEDTRISNDDPIANRRRQAALDKERQERQAKTEKEREAVRQKIRDKYNIKKKDEPSNPPANSKTTTTLNETTKKIEMDHASGVENQGFAPVKVTTDFFNNIKKKFGWK